MLRSGLRSGLVICSSGILAVSMAVSGCHSNSRPDDRMAIYNALDKNDLRSVTVSQDRGNGTITLSGIVGSNDSRQRAEQIARQTAPDYQVVNRLEVENVGIQSDAVTQKAQLDSAIESQFKDTLSSHPSLKSQKIQVVSANGTLTLKGTVRTEQEKRQAEDLAKKVPEVQHVVNQIHVQPGKPSPANS